MQENRMDTIKRFPRTLQEAFPQDYREQFDPLYQPPADHAHPDRWVMLFCAFAGGFVVGLLAGG